MTGRPLSAFQQTHQFGDRPYQTLKIGLRLERKELYRRPERGTVGVDGGKGDSRQEKDRGMKSESKLQAEILRYLRSLGIWCWVIKAAVCNERGVPDILCCYKGYFVGLEVKTAAGKVSGPQKLQIKRIQMARGRAAVVRSVDQVKELLEEIDKEDNQ